MTLLPWLLTLAQGEDCSNPYVIPSAAPYSQGGFSTCGMGNDYTNATNICQSTFMGGEDFVFEFTPDVSGCHNITLTNIGGILAASVMVTDGCPDDPASTCLGNAIIIPALGVVLNAGETYYITVSSYLGFLGGTPCFDFDIDIDISYSTVPNDFCDNALPLSGNATNYGATNCGEPNAWAPTGFCSGSADWSSNENGVWFTFYNDIQQDVDIDVYSIVCNGVSGGLLQIGVWTNSGTCDLDQESLMGCVVTNGTVTLTLPNLPVGEYYLFADGDGGDQCTWYFDSIIIDPNECAACDGNPPPANDSCDSPEALGALPDPGECDAGATGLLVGETLLLTGSNICASPGSPYEVVPGNCNGGSPQANPAADVWYSFESTGTQVDIQLAASGVSMYNPNLALYELNTDCGNLAPIACTVGIGGNAVLQADVSPEATYYLQVSGSDMDDQCEFSLNLRNDWDCSVCAIGIDLPADTSFCGPLSGSIFLDAEPTAGQPPFTYEWLEDGVPMGISDPILEVTAVSGSVQYTVQVSNGCTSATQTTTITSNEFPTIDNIATSGSCDNASGSLNASVTGTPPISYLWDGPTAIGDTDNGQNLEAGGYQLTITDGNGCSATGAANIPTFDAPLPPLSGTTSFCVGGSAFLEAGPGFGYLWSDGSTQQSISPDVEDTYCLTITDASGCSADTCVLVTQNTELAPDLGADVEVCEGDAVTLGAGSGFGGYEWSDASTDASIQPTASGEYCVTVSDALGCTGSDCATVTFHLIPTPPVVQQPDAYCQDEAVEDLGATLQFGGIITWYDGMGNEVGFGETLTPPNLPTLGDPVSYYATETLNGCEGPAAEVALSVIDCSCTAPNPPLAVADSLNVCAGNATAPFEAQGDANTIIKWYDSLAASQAIDSGETFLPVSPGVYYAETRNLPEDGCSSERVAFGLYETDVEAGITSSVGEPAVLESGDTVTLAASGSPDGVVFSWSSQPPDVSLACPGCTEITVSPTQSTVYTLTATHAASGCTATANISVELALPFALVPNAFSPNNDGMNDFFKIASGRGVLGVSYLVYNRWGQKVYSYAGTDLNIGWDGTFNGKQQEVGTYVYYIEASFVDGSTESYQGSLILVR